MRKLAMVALLALQGLGVAQAAPINFNGTYNDSGYGLIGFSVASATTVDLQYTGGYANPTLSLFDTQGSNGGTHLVTNNDANGSYFSHITQVLNPGLYTLAVGFHCCVAEHYAQASGATLTSTDGFNTGDYWFGGNGDLWDFEAISDNYAFLLTIVHNSGGKNPAGWDDVPAGAPFEVAISDLFGDNVSLVDLPANVQGVPEPQSIILGVTALLAIAVLRRRRHISPAFQG